MSASSLRHSRIVAEPSRAFPLSARQTLLWLDDQLYPDARYHNLVQTVDIRGKLDVPRLREAFDEVVAAHDALRMCIDSSEARQFCADEVFQRIEILDIQPCELEQYVRERCSRRLNEGGLLWDAALLRLGEERFVFYFCQDHIITDGASVALMLRELEDRYVNRPVSRAASYRDYLAFEAGYRASPKVIADKAYWDAKLAGGAPSLRPLGLARSDTSAALDRVPFEAPLHVAQPLLALAEDEPFCFLSPGFSRLVVTATVLTVLLYRITGNREVVIGVPLRNRRDPFKQTLGLLMEQLFLRIRVEEGDTFRTLGVRVREEVRASLSHSPCCVSDRGIEYVTLNLMQRQPTQFAGMRADFQFGPATTIPGCQSGSGDMRDTLGLQVMDFSDGVLQFAFDFHKATFDSHSQSQIRSQLLQILNALVGNVDQLLDTLVLTDAKEHGELLVLSAGREPGQAAIDLVEQFRAIARRRENHPAVIGSDTTFSYAELDSVTNRLAHRLIALGVTRESRVGVAVPRGAGELCALLATLKAGGAYVPVDPSHPVERVKIILADALPQVLIAPPTSALLGALPEGTAFLPFDNVLEAVEGFADDPLDVAFEPDQTGYILFTSGSTGRPKGVEVPRGAFANFLRSMAHTPGLSEADRLLAITTTTFDIAGLELFLPLYVGATVVVPDRDVSADPRGLRELLESDSFTVMQGTPATWRLLIDSGYRGDHRLKMLVGGEALSPELARAMLDRGGQLWNLYGPTETTVWSSVERVERNFDRITIGRPIDCTQMFVLDPALQIVPAQVIGEIYIGGMGLARGYRGRPDLTSERFLPNPFGPEGSRLYRTGDLGRILPDGRFECLGRADFQVKIRGFRIELGEIESVLRMTGGVQEAVVTVDAQKGASEPRLVAYWVGEADRQALYDNAREKLPQYMIPSAYMRLPKFPLTTSGKIDRKALPPAEPLELPPESLHLARNPIERRIAKIFSDVLGITAVGVDQDFFALGGTSVLVIQARERFKREFQVDLPLKAFFESPTVAAIARQFDSVEAGVERQDGCLIQLKPGTSSRALFLVHDADGEVLLYRNLALRMPREIAVYGVVPLVAGRFTMGHCTIADMAVHYVEEIRKRQPRGPYYLGGLCAGGVIAFEVARLLTEMGEKVALLALVESISPLARIRPSPVSRVRLQRSMDLLKSARSSGIAALTAEMRRRLRNLWKYEVGVVRRKALAAVAAYVRTSRIATVVDWPSWLPVPTTRDTYLNAVAHYVPQPIDGVSAILIRATEHANNEPPAIEICECADLGWSAVLGSGLKIVDSLGGHSTILQERTVGEVADHFRAAIAPRMRSGT